MKPRSLLAIILATLLLIAFFAVWRLQTLQRREQVAPLPQTPAVAPEHSRLVSLVPAVTEMVYMLGLGTNLVGRSDYCDFPDVATNLPSVGSLGSVNVESIARLKPDFVLLSDAQAQARLRQALEKLHIAPIEVPVNSLDQIFQSVWDVAERFNATGNAELWLEHVNDIIAQAKAHAPESPPRMLICAGRHPDSLERIYISGRGNFYEGIVNIVGGTNAYDGPLPFPVVSREGVLKMNPDIIVDIIVGDAAIDGAEKALGHWSRLSTVNAVKTGDVHILTDTWAVRPGPRIDRLVRSFSGYVRKWNEGHDH
ncbi:MAG: ABC transporter substrate-binding protein [Kiritimatiellia bacterium]|jgi:iron complex transport system substrate-binding protein